MTIFGWMTILGSGVLGCALAWAIARIEWVVQVRKENPLCEAAGRTVGIMRQTGESDAELRARVERALKEKSPTDRKLTLHNGGKR